ncbi:MAG: FliH/SctL family protein, partial [Alphaproteobacteria bacterium]
MHSASAKPFMFDLSFDDPASERAAQREVVRFTEAELEEARQKSLAEGRALGVAEAQASIESRLAAVTARLGESMASLSDMVAAERSLRIQEAMTIARTVTMKALPALAEQTAESQVSHLVQTCMEQLIEEPRIVVRVHPALLDAIKDRSDELAATTGFSGKIVVIAEDGFAADDCRVEWADGGAKRDRRSLMAAIAA